MININNYILMFFSPLIQCTLSISNPDRLFPFITRKSKYYPCVKVWFMVFHAINHRTRKKPPTCCKSPTNFIK